MIALLRNGDYCPDGMGGFRQAWGGEEVLERVLFQLTARRGSFPLLPQVGSRLYLRGREKPAARGTVGAGYAAEALAEVPDLQVTGATWDEGGQRLHVDIRHLADADACGADGLHEQLQPLPAQRPGGCQKPLVLFPGEFLAFLPEQPPLDAQGFYLALLPPQEIEKAVEGNQHPVDGAGRILAGKKVFLPCGCRFLCGGIPAHPSGERPHVPYVIFNGPRGAFILPPFFFTPCELGFGTNSLFQP